MWSQASDSRDCCYLKNSESQIMGFDVCLGAGLQCWDQALTL